MMTQARWRELTDWPLTGAALAFLIAYSWEVIANLQGTAAVWCNIVIWVTWAAFVADYVVSFVLAQPRWRWFRKHLLDLAIVALPVLRPLRLLRLVTVISVLQQRAIGTRFRGRVVTYTAVSAVLLVYAAALAELDAERGVPGASISTFGDSLWWSAATITTVGDAAFSPVSITGRFVAIGLMIGGISLLGVVTATFASWIVERVAHKEETEQAATRGQIADLLERFSQLETRLVRETGQAADDGDGQSA
jgi:voltage-gated potassium channel